MLNNLNPADYQGRLHNSIIRYDGIPVSLSVQGPDTFRLAGIHIGSEFKQRDVKSTDKKIDISSPKLGWFNCHYDGVQYAIYAERSPVRRWRQGLCSTNVNMHKLVHGILRNQGSRDYMYCEGFEELILNKYRPLDDILKKMKEPDVLSQAISRNIAIASKDNIYTIWFKKDEVGWMKPGTKVVKVAKEDNAYLISKFLKEVQWEVE